jgi:hypothetical protein
VKDDPKDPRSEIKKRLLLSSHFGTAFKIKKVEDTLLEIKDSLMTYPALVKAKAEPRI